MKKDRVICFLQGMLAGAILQVLILALAKHILT